MTVTPDTLLSPVVVTGANGLVGARVCAALAERGVTVRALVRRAGTAPRLENVEEHVGDFTDADDAARVLEGAAAAVTTVHPMASDLETQRTIGVEGTTRFARAAAHAGAVRLVHVSTAAVYDRSPGVGDVTEGSDLVGDDAGDYPVTKRDLDLALAEVEGPTVVLVRPPAILGAGESSVWNTLRPRAIADDASQRTGVPDQSFAWVHVDDLAAIIADVAVGTVEGSLDPDAGPLPGGCTPVNVAGAPATIRDYLGTVTDALGVEPTWDDETPAWTGRIAADRAIAWGWRPTMSKDDALREVAEGLRR